MWLTRVAAELRRARLGWRSHQARRAERLALIRLGEAVAVAPAARPDPRVARVLAAQPEIEALETAVRASYAADRTDVPAVGWWMRPVVRLRGICARGVLRHRIGRTRAALAPHYEQIGTAAADETARGDLPIPRALLSDVAAARLDLHAALADRASPVPPARAVVAPRWVTPLRREGAALGRAFWAHLKPRVFPRASALAGFAAGWWVTSTYTDSHWRAALHSVGIGHGARHVVSGTSYRAMAFWLPILAAALCAYLGDRAATLLRRRWRPTPPP
jgi:hypothetical protein